jgi:5-methylcytosine-specific restriction endonuclease McrBC regulatory subunit McrC
MKIQKLVDLINMNGNKFIRYVKMKWISMLFPTKWVYIEYCSWIVKIHSHNAKSEVALKKLNVLCDLEFILRFPQVSSFA